MMRRAALLVALVALALPSGAGAAVNLGILGNAPRFDSLTGQHSTVQHVILGWNQGYTWGSRLSALIPRLGEMPMIGLNTGAGWPNRHEAITPRDIAYGKGDGYLVALNQALAALGRPAYLRPFGEMNGHWNYYSAFTSGGASKGASHSTEMFRKAFARVYLAAHGGRRSTRAWPGSGYRRSRAHSPRTRSSASSGTRRARAAPTCRATRRRRTTRATRYVDVVGDDLYNIGGKAQWDAAQALYKAHPNKPFAFPEWSNWGIDDPAFIEQMAAWVRRHPRVEMLAWFESRPGSKFDIASMPRSLAAYRRLIVPLGR